MKARRLLALSASLLDTLQPVLRLEQTPPGPRVLALSPLIGDAMIGCGGTLRKHATAGHRVHCLNLLDCDDERIKEGERAARILGLTKQTFWEFERQTFEVDEVASRLLDLLEDESPDVVYLPSCLGQPRSALGLHRAVARACEANRYGPLLYLYELDTVVVPNCVVDITEQVELKRAAMRELSWRLADHDWIDGILGLNRYRGLVSPAQLYAEGFLRTTVKEYLRLVRTIL